MRGIAFATKLQRDRLITRKLWSPPPLIPLVQCYLRPCLTLVLALLVAVSEARFRDVHSSRTPPEGNGTPDSVLIHAAERS